MAEEACYTEAVSLSTYIRSCDTVEEAFGITLERMRSLEQVTKQLTEGGRTVAEALHAVATYPRFTEYERVYVTFKLTEQIAWSLRTLADDDEDPDEGPGIDI